MTSPHGPAGRSGAAGTVGATVVWSRREGVLWRRSGDALVLLVPDADDLVTLSSTGQALWEALAEPADLTQVAKSLSALYGIDADTVAADIEPFLVDLERRHVVARSR